MRTNFKDQEKQYLLVLTITTLEYDVNPVNKYQFGSLKVNRHTRVMPWDAHVLLRGKEVLRENKISKMKI